MHARDLLGGADSLESLLSVLSYLFANDVLHVMKDRRVLIQRQVENRMKMYEKGDARGKGAMKTRRPHKLEQISQKQCLQLEPASQAQRPWHAAPRFPPLSERLLHVTIVTFSTCLLCSS